MCALFESTGSFAKGSLVSAEPAAPSLLGRNYSAFEEFTYVVEDVGVIAE